MQNKKIPQIFSSSNSFYKKPAFLFEGGTRCPFDQELKVETPIAVFSPTDQFQRTDNEGTNWAEEEGWEVNARVENELSIPSPSVRDNKVEMHYWISL